MALHELCKTSEVPEGTCKAFSVNGKGVALHHVEGKFYATQDFCRHKGGSLGKGTLEGAVVICPLHGWRFDVTTGDCLTQPHCRKLALFPTSVVDDKVHIEL